MVGIFEISFFKEFIDNFISFKIFMIFFLESKRARPRKVICERKTTPCILSCSKDCFGKPRIWSCNLIWSGNLYHTALLLQETCCRVSFSCRIPFSFWVLKLLNKEKRNIEIEGRRDSILLSSWDIG